MKWKTKKPTKPGYYAWRCIGQKEPANCIAHLQRIQGELRIKFNQNEFNYAWLEHSLDREYFGPLPE